jgi:hypothetical protein
MGGTNGYHIFCQDRKDDLLKEGKDITVFISNNREFKKS